MPHNLKDPYLTKIGDVVVSFALLELHLQTLATSLINEHQRVGQIICAELSLKNLRALISSLYLDRHGKDDHYDNVKDILSRVGGIEDIRNGIVHSIWAGSGEDHIHRIKMTAKQKNGLKFNFEKVSLDDLQNVINDINSVSIDINKLHSLLLDEGKIVNNPIKPYWPTKQDK
jgi:hypothetical protein